MEHTRTGLANQGREALRLQRPLNSRRPGGLIDALTHGHSESGDPSLDPSSLSGDLLTAESPPLLGFLIPQSDSPSLICCS